MPAHPVRHHAGVSEAEESVLVNFWYAHPLGHAIEALHYCLGYHAANPARRVSVVLNAATPVELASLCEFVSGVYPVAYSFGAVGDEPPDFQRIPARWDWVVDDARRYDPRQCDAFLGFARYYEAADAYFQPELGKGVAGWEPPNYAPHQQLRLALPEEARERAAELVAGPIRIALMPAGSGPRWVYPSLSSWSLVLSAFISRYPAATIGLLGKAAVDERTKTTFGRYERQQLLRSGDRIVDWFDLDLVTQLAVVEACDVFVSPHTGFGMAALAVGTPWLTISGGQWPEYFYNRVPFRSVLPDSDRYPCYTGLDGPLPVLDHDSDGEGPRTPSMTHARIKEDLDRIVAAAEDLIGERLSYETALSEHFDRLMRFFKGDRACIWSIDGVHAEYV
jgi:hypothetical protein